VRKKVVRYGLAGIVVLFFLLFVSAIIMKCRSKGRLAPGIVVCGRDVSGLTIEETEKILEEIVPEFVTEVRCRILPEHQEEVRKRLLQECQAEENLIAGEQISIDLQERELVLSAIEPPVRILAEDTLLAVLAESNEVKLWEWLYKEVTGTCFRIRQAEPVLVWEEEQFGEWLSMLAEQAEQESVNATVSLKNGKIRVTESKNGIQLNREKAWADTEELMRGVTERLKTGSVERMVLRLYVEGGKTHPNLSTEQAKACNTVVGEFATSFAGAGEGRRQNIKAGAKHLHGKVILPGEEFSVAAALMPFTEENGYAAGGTYIDGQLAESIGGGVCQLSTTLYNALLQTKLEITERYPHSLPVGYVPLGQDAAIAGDYKDLKFRNTTASPVVVSCEIEKETVQIKLYGTETIKRDDVSFETVLTEETKESVTVEVYRTEKGLDGETVRERVSVNKYRVKE